MQPASLSKDHTNTLKYAFIDVLGSKQVSEYEYIFNITLYLIAKANELRPDLKYDNKDPNGEKLCSQRSWNLCGYCDYKLSVKK